MKRSAIYFYLDQEDGYAKGPYAWEDLKQLPLGTGHYIYNQQTHSWLTFEEIIGQISAESAARVRPAKKGNVVPGPEPATGTHTTANRPPEQRTLPHKEAKRSQSPPPEPRNFPPVLTRPNLPALPGTSTDNPMGISGRGCFFMAIAAAFLIGLLFFLL